MHAKLFVHIFYFLLENTLEFGNMKCILHSIAFHFCMQNIQIVVCRDMDALYMRNEMVFSLGKKVFSRLLRWLQAIVVAATQQMMNDVFAHYIHGIFRFHQTKKKKKRNKKKRFENIKNIAITVPPSTITITTPYIFLLRLYCHCLSFKWILEIGRYSGC